MKALRKLLDLPAAEKRVLWRAWWMLLGVDWGLRVSSLAKVHGWMGQGLTPQPAPEAPRQLAWATWRLVDAAARHHLYRMTCLRQALVLQRLLAERGLAVEVRLGARRANGVMQAHAWIEVEGEAVGEERGVAEAFVPVLKL